MKFGILVTALAVVTACGNSKPANDADDVDLGSGKTPQTEDAGPGNSGPADTSGTSNAPASPGPAAGSVPDATPKPGGGSGPGTGSGNPG